MSQLLIIDGHPNPDSLCAELARRYVQAAQEAGAKVQLLAIRDLSFDPVLHLGYQDRQPLEPDLTQAQAAILACKHLTLVTPVWWGSMPALLKGFLDRTLERGWAFRYAENGLPQGLLRGRSAHLVVTTDSPLWYLRWIQGDPTVRSLVRSTLRFCGFAPVGLTRFGPVHHSTPQVRDRWFAQMSKLGALHASRLQKSRPQ